MGFSSDEGCGAAGYGDKIRNSVRQVMAVDVDRVVFFFFLGPWRYAYCQG